MSDMKHDPIPTNCMKWDCPHIQVVTSTTKHYECIKGHKDCRFCTLWLEWLETLNAIKENNEKG